ncbi:MAG TPA: helix-turn-helix transcriptional regulator [Bacillales bacterium]|nr:helix-turn-helix transcriptional regulator [Bacillales bacterium]
MEAEQWGRKIRAFRKLKGHTQESLAREMNLSVSVIGEVERGNRYPSKQLLVDIAETLQITVDDLTPEESTKDV